MSATGTPVSSGHVLTLFDAQRAFRRNVARCEGMPCPRWMNRNALLALGAVAHLARVPLGPGLAFETCGCEWALTLKEGCALSALLQKVVDTLFGI